VGLNGSLGASFRAALNDAGKRRFFYADWSSLTQRQVLQGRIMDSVSKAAGSCLFDRHNITRRDFLKTSLVTSVAATAVGAPVIGQSAAEKDELQTGHQSIIAVSGARPRRSYENRGRTRLLPGEVIYLELRAQGEAALPTTRNGTNWQSGTQPGVARKSSRFVDKRCRTSARHSGMA